MVNQRSAVLSVPALRLLVRREFKPCQESKDLLFSCARNFIRIALYLVVPANERGGKINKLVVATIDRK